MAKLYEITNEYQTLCDMSLETDEDVRAFLDLMNGVKAEFDTKAENLVKLIRNIESEADAYKAEADALMKRARVEQNRADRIKDYLEREFRAIGGGKRTVGLFTLAIQKNPPALDIVNEKAVPEEYCIYERKIDKSKLKDALKDGAEIIGVSLVQRDSMRIKI